MEGDRQVLLDMGAVSPLEVTVLRETASSRTLRWRMIGALLAVALCAAAALFFAWHSEVRDHTEGAEDIRHTLRQISGSVRAAIHLEGEYNLTFTTSVEWRKEVDHYHSEGGLELDDNEIVIPRRGLYFIYSQASFHVSCHVSATESATATRQDARNMVHLSHTVQRWSDSYGNDDAERTYRTILHSVRTACEKTVSNDPEHEGKWYGSVYMGAVFSLNRGDRLRTVMERSLLPQVEGHAGNTFFGVFAL